MSDEVALRQVHLGAAHAPTGFIRHYAGESLLPPPRALSIVRYAAGEGFYLLSLDASGEAQTDTWHESLESALEQARLEFSINPDEWSAPTA